MVVVLRKLGKPLFITKVQSAALAGMISYILTEKDYKALDRAVINKNCEAC